MSQNTAEERACQSPNVQGITSENLNTILTEVGAKPINTPISKVIEACNQSTDSPKKQASVAESKRILENFKEKLAVYPKYLTYEGSVVLCVILSIGDNNVNLSGLPRVDQDTILAQLLPNASVKLAAKETMIIVEFDEIKDFILTYGPVEDLAVTVDGVPRKKLKQLYFLNTVIHPTKPLNTNVPIEQDGDIVKVGNNLILNPRRVQELVGNSSPSKDKDEEPPRRQAVSGRNAFEIRFDVLALASEWINKHDPLGQKNDDDVLSIARKFYSFVEDRRGR